MTVAELIEQLQALPRYAQDHLVRLSIVKASGLAVNDIVVNPEHDGVILIQDANDCAAYPDLE